MGSHPKKKPPEIKRDAQGRAIFISANDPGWSLEQYQAWSREHSQQATTEAERRSAEDEERKGALEIVTNLKAPHMRWYPALLGEPYGLTPDGVTAAAYVLDQLSLAQIGKSGEVRVPRSAKDIHSETGVCLDTAKDAIRVLGEAGLWRLTRQTVTANPDEIDKALGPYWAYPKWLVPIARRDRKAGQRGLNGSELAVLLRLLDLMAYQRRENGTAAIKAEAWVGQQKLAVVCHMAENTVTTALNNLKTLGYVIETTPYSDKPRQVYVGIGKGNKDGGKVESRPCAHGGVRKIDTPDGKVKNIAEGRHFRANWDSIVARVMSCGRL